MFGDELKTRKMVISERSQTVGEYEGYTTLEGITKYTAGIIGIILSKPGETVAEKMDALIRENADLKEQISGGKEMMAMLWAQQIILGKKTYGQVPRLLKDKVKEILEDSGMADLVKEDEEKA